MPDISNQPDKLRTILQNARVIAVVGHSHLPDKDSYRIAQYLRGQGYTVYPVNPTIDTIDGQPSYPTLADVPEPIDVVDVFRGARHLPGIVDDAAAVGAPVVWGQFTVTHPDAVTRADAAGIALVMDRCIKVEHARLVRSQV